VKFAPEGYPFIASFAGVTVLLAFAGGPWLAAPGVVLCLFMAYFFRDPERSVPGGGDLFVSPADGKILLVRQEYDADHLQQEGIEVSIFMSPLDVHVNRAPCDGSVVAVVPKAGKFLSAFKPEASVVNQSISMVLQTEYGKVLVRQVAGFVARRAVCRVKPGETLRRGDRYGIIKFSSRVDIYLPKETEIRVKVGDRVKAGETVLGVVR
jgi:phosphatidylserine decarboxylase